MTRYPICPECERAGLSESLPCPMRGCTAPPVMMVDDSIIGEPLVAELAVARPTVAALALVVSGLGLVALVVAL